MSNLNNILLKRAVSKKGSVLFCVLCVMTFVVMLAGIALALTSSAHQSVIYEENNQQAYYTAKSAVDSVVAYLDSNGTTGSGTTLSYKVGQLDSENYKKVVNFADAILTADEINKIRDPWPKDTDQRRSNWDTAAGAGTYVAGEWSTDYAGIGKYRVDIYPTLAKGLYKIIAESEYKGHTSVVAAVISPGKAQAFFEDAIVGLSSATINGSTRIIGGLALNTPTFANSSVYLGGNITNKGTLDFSQNQNAIPKANFERAISSGEHLMLSAQGDLKVGKIKCEDEPIWDQKMFQYYAYLVCENNLTFYEWNHKDAYVFASQYSDNSINSKGIFAGGDLLSEASDTSATFTSTVYVKGSFKIKGGDCLFKEPVYVQNINVNGGTFVFEKGLYILDGSTSNISAGITGNIYCNNTTLISGSSLLPSDIDGKIDECEEVMQEKLAQCNKVDNYGNWEFTADQNKMMGVNATAAELKTVNQYTIDVAGGQPRLTTTYNDVSIANTGYNLQIKNSGVINAFDLQGSSNGNCYIYIDTNTINSSGASVYKNIYIGVNCNVTKDNLNKCKFFIKGKGNVYFYLFDGKTWKSNEMTITGDDFDTADGGLQPHLFMISNSSSSNNPNDAVIDLGSANGTDWDLFSVYIYAPNGLAGQTGSSGFRGAIISKYVFEDGGSNCSCKFISPSSKAEEGSGFPNGSVSSGYSVKTWYKY